MAKLLTAPEVADLMGLSVKTIYQMVELRQIPFVRIGRSIRFDPDEIEKFIQSRKNASPKTRKRRNDNNTNELTDSRK